MIEIHGRLHVQDFDTFWSGFQPRSLPLREKHGSRGARVLQSVDDPQQVVVVLTWESREAFEGFRADPEVQESMRKGGAMGPPDFVFVSEAGTLPA